MIAAERVVIGAGLAGCAAAVALARGGAPPLLLERTATVQPRICGEFISVEAAAALAALGVDVQALGGRPTQRLRLAAGGLRIEAELPFRAIGLSRCALDGALQQAAVAAGARLIRGQRVTLEQLAQPPLRFGLRLAGGERVETSTLLLACGKTDLAPVARRPRRPPEALVGVQLHLVLGEAARSAIDGTVEVVLFGGGYAGLQSVEGDRVNLCLLVAQERLRLGLPALLQALRQECSLLDERLEGAVWCGPPQTIARVPYGHLHRPGPSDPPGLWRLGDQAAVIPSFTGDGMALALYSAALASEDLLAGRPASHFHRRLHRSLRWQIGGATALYRIGRTASGQRALLGLLRRWPALLGFIATMTRAPQMPTTAQDMPAWA